MKRFIILFALVAFVSSATIKPEDEEKEHIAILRSEQNQSEDGSYNFEYEGSDGTAREETADIVDKGTEDQALKITGSYRYIDANGDEVVVTYTADENGFVPIGTNIAKEISDVALAAKDLPNSYEEDEAERKAHKSQKSA